VYRAAVLVVGLTGGIGSGKSTVSASLAERGAVVIDADLITHEMQASGTVVFESIVERFGAGVVGTDGELDRAALADIVFADADAKAALEAIVHPAVGAEIAARLAAEAATDHVVILDIPLLVESGFKDLAGIIVVDTDPEIAVQRLVQQRALREADARARIAAQASRDERLARADFVIPNSGSREELEQRVDQCWEWVRSLG
jgi:dephospho-CoA kinase